MVSTITSVVPEPVRVKVREYWDALRDVFRKDTGQSDDKAEADGWGVEEARERNREEASKSTPPPYTRATGCIDLPGYG